MTNELEQVFKTKKSLRDYITSCGDKPLSEILKTEIYGLENQEEKYDDFNDTKIDIEITSDRPNPVVMKIDLTQKIQTFMHLVNGADKINAKTLIWLITKEDNDCLETVEKINSHMYEGIDIYVIKCHLNDDKIAFKLLLKPEVNRQKKPLKESRERKITNTNIKQQEFWTKFQNYCDKNQTDIQIPKPEPKHYHYASKATGKSSIYFTISLTKKYVSCELRVTDDKLFTEIEGRKLEFEEALGRLEWIVKDGQKMKTIRNLIDIDTENELSWDEAFECLLGTAEKFKMLLK